MSISIVPQQFNFEGDLFRVGIGDDGEPLFVAPDVCKVLEISNVSQALSRLDSDEKDDLIINDTIGRSQSMNAVTESGLYSLILTSRKPKAKTFKRWVTHEVLPTLRKTGAYSIKPLSALETLQQTVAALTEQHRLITEQHDQIEDIYGILGNTDQRVSKVEERLDHSDYMTVLDWCKSQRIKYTAALLNKWGHDCSAESRARRIEIIQVSTQNKQYPFESAYHKSVLLDMVTAKPKPSKQLPLV